MSINAETKQISYIRQKFKSSLLFGFISIYAFVQRKRKTLDGYGENVHFQDLKITLPLLAIIWDAQF
jgi:hypothetical protein